MGNLRKPRYWAVHLAAHQGDRVLDARLSGDGADVVVQAWATRHDDGTVDVLVWNGTINAALVGGDLRLDRTVRVSVEGLAPDGARPVALARVDEHHSNILDGYPVDTPWPDAALWARLRERDHLHEEALEPVPAGARSLDLEVHLPMPSVVRLRIGAPNAPG